MTLENDMRKSKLRLAARSNINRHLHGPLRRGTYEPYSAELLHTLFGYNKYSALVDAMYDNDKHLTEMQQLAGPNGYAVFLSMWRKRYG